MSVMSTIGCRHSFEAAHRLPFHPGKCKNLHGHTYVVEATFTGQVSPTTGMVVDFGDLNTAVKAALSTFDHSTLLWAEDPLYKLLRSTAFSERVVPLGNPPTVENLVSVLVAALRSAVSESRLAVSLILVRVYETPDCWAEEAC